MRWHPCPWNFEPVISKCFKWPGSWGCREQTPSHKESWHLVSSFTFAQWSTLRDRSKRSCLLTVRNLNGNPLSPSCPRSVAREWDVDWGFAKTSYGWAYRSYREVKGVISTLSYVAGWDGKQELNSLPWCLPFIDVCSLCWAFCLRHFP